MKKSLAALLLVFAIVSTMAGCRGDATGHEQSSSTPTPTVSAAARTTPTPTPVPSPKATLPPVDVDEEETVTVYVTETGSKYHSAGCQYLSRSCIPMDLDDAKQSYDPCSKCHPPK